MSFMILYITFSDCWSLIVHDLHSGQFVSGERNREACSLISNDGVVFGSLKAFAKINNEHKARIMEGKAAVALPRQCFSAWITVNPRLPEENGRYSHSSTILHAKFSAYRDFPLRQPAIHFTATKIWHRTGDKRKFAGRPEGDAKTSIPGLLPGLGKTLEAQCRRGSETFEGW